MALACGHGFCPRCFEVFLRRRWAALAAQEVPTSEKEQIPCPACGINLLRKDVHTLTGVELEKLCKRARERGSHFGHGPVPPGSLAHLTTGSGRFAVSPLVAIPGAIGSASCEIHRVQPQVTLPGMLGGNSCEIQRMQPQATAMTTTTATSIETRSCPSHRPLGTVKTPPRLDAVLSAEALWAQANVYRNISLGTLQGASATSAPPSTTAPTVTPIDPSKVAERIAAAAASAPAPLSPVSPTMSEPNVNAWRHRSQQIPDAAAVWPQPASPHSPTTASMPGGAIELGRRKTSKSPNRKVQGRESSRAQVGSAGAGAGASATAPASGAMPQRRSMQLPAPTFGGVPPRRISSAQRQRAGLAL